MPLRTWTRTGARVFTWSRRTILALPLRIAWTAADRVVFAWWWYTEAASPAKLPPYVKAEELFGRAYFAAYRRLVVIIQREIGD